MVVRRIGRAMDRAARCCLSWPPTGEIGEVRRHGQLKAHYVRRHHTRNPVEPADLDLRRVGGGPAAHVLLDHRARVERLRHVADGCQGRQSRREHRRRSLLCRYLYDRYGLTAGASYRGPAVVEERESTTVIGPDARFTIDKYLN